MFLQEPRFYDAFNGLVPTIFTTVAKPEFVSTKSLFKFQVQGKHKYRGAEHDENK